MEIRDTLKQVGEKYEPEHSDFHLQQAATLEEFNEIQEMLKDKETRKLAVKSLFKILILRLLRY